MAIPDYETTMLPLLNLLRDGKDRTIKTAIVELASFFNLTEDEKRTLLPSGKQQTFNNRVGWARTYMKKAGLLETPERGVMRITTLGQELLSENLNRIDSKVLKRYPSFLNFKSRTKSETDDSKNNESVTLAVTPEERLDSAFTDLRDGLAAELLETVLACSPVFFESLVLDVLVSMGYGGSRHDAGEAVGKSGDGGIDGIIKEDKLGLEIIYIQAKRWGSTVGRPEIQKFAGALQGRRAKKGVFITTSDFSREAKDYVSKIDNNIVLIDGKTLADLMVDHNVGVSVLTKYEVKRIDIDYFEE
ncbi:restriction endonuclease [Gemmatimonas aurantiaca]|nr:restriction endonuclease [Gemmatimonas aurantiaca]